MQQACSGPPMEKDRRNSEGFVRHSVVSCEWFQFDIYRKQSIFTGDFVGSEMG